jgi:hypothetical protein
MSVEKAEIVAGFPEFWPRVQAKYPLFFSAARELEPVLNEIFRGPAREPLHKVLRLIAKIVSNSFGAVRVLVLNGYGNDAMRVARSMFEGAVISGYLKLHPDKLDDYLDWHWIRQKRMLEYMERYAPEEFQRLDPATVEDAKRGFDTVKHRYTDKRGKLRKSWNDRPLRQMAEEVGLGQQYRTYYDSASSVHHLDFGGLSMQAEHETFDVDVAPSEEWLDRALIMGHCAVLRCLVNYNEAASLGVDEELKAAGENIRCVWGRGRNAGQ